MSEQVKAGTCWKAKDGGLDCDYWKWNGSEIIYCDDDYRSVSQYTLERVLEKVANGEFVEWTDPRDAVVAAARDVDGLVRLEEMGSISIGGTSWEAFRTLRTALSALDRAGGGDVSGGTR